MTDVHLARSYDLAESMTDGILLVPAISLSTYKEAAVSYIAGFVCLMAKTKKKKPGSFGKLAETHSALVMEVHIDLYC